MKEVLARMNTSSYTSTPDNGMHQPKALYYPVVDSALLVIQGRS